jgi:hypothetical protein
MVSNVAPSRKKHHGQKSLFHVLFRKSNFMKHIDNTNPTAANICISHPLMTWPSARHTRAAWFHPAYLFIVHYPLEFGKDDLRNVRPGNSFKSNIGHLSHCPILPFRPLAFVKLADQFIGRDHHLLPVVGSGNR